MQLLRETGGWGDAILAFLKIYFTSARIPPQRKALPGPRLTAMAVVRSGGDARAAKLILVILLVENVPLLAAFEDFFFLRSDSLAHFQLDLLFVFQRGRQNLHPLLPNGVAVFHG